MHQDPIKIFTVRNRKEAIDLFNKVRSTNFRSWKTPAVLVDFVPRWLEHHGYAKIRQSNSLYIESGSNEIEIELDQLNKSLVKSLFFVLTIPAIMQTLWIKGLQLVSKQMETLLPKNLILKFNKLSNAFTRNSYSEILIWIH